MERKKRVLNSGPVSLFVSFVTWPEMHRAFKTWLLLMVFLSFSFLFIIAHTVPVSTHFKCLLCARHIVTDHFHISHINSETLQDTLTTFAFKASHNDLIYRRYLILFFFIRRETNLRVMHITSAYCLPFLESNQQIRIYFPFKKYILLGHLGDSFG